MVMENNLSHLDLPETTMTHRNIILSKPFLKRIYIDWYVEFKNFSQQQSTTGKVVEIGSGGGFLKEIYPSVITSDIMPLSVCDMQFSAHEMPFENNSLKAIFMLNVLHHIPDNEQFLQEAQRTLQKGGFIYMIEPANTFFSRFIYKNFHHEPFDETVADWKFESKGPLSDANGTIPWMIFKRDLKKFNQLFPELELEIFRYHTPIKYLLSGGLSKPNLIPYFLFGLVTFIEKLLTPLNSKIALFQTIIVRKK